MPSVSPERTKVFISYSHQDDQWLKRLHVHLKPLVRNSTIDLWDDTRISPGAQWREEIAKAIKASKVAILLISADFLASDFIASDELPPLLEAAENEGAIILPIIVSPSLFSKTQGLSQFQAVNSVSKPLISVNKLKQEEIFVKVAEIVESMVGRKEIREELSEVRENLSQVNEKVARLFLLTMSEQMFFNLQKLASPEGFGSFEMGGPLQRELYHLRDIGYIEVAAIRKIPKSGSNLSDYVKITNAGREFVELRKAMREILKLGKEA